MAGLGRIALGTYLFRCDTDDCPERGAEFTAEVTELRDSFFGQFHTGFARWPDVPRHIPCGCEPRLISINGKSVKGDGS